MSKPTDPASGKSPYPPDSFARWDESDDSDFYREPRLVTHIDDATIAALTQIYRELIPSGGDILDLMSSWVSHLPPEARYRRVVGLGMNRHELEQNLRLDEWIVRDLNREPELPFPDGAFDAVLNAVSVQYLTRPIEVFASVWRTLKPGGIHLVAISHRMFPTKAVAVWQALDSHQHVQLVSSYFKNSRAWDAIGVLDRSPAAADPLWVISAQRPS